MSRPYKFGKTGHSFDSETSVFTTPPLSPRSAQLASSQLVSYHASGAHGGHAAHGNPTYYVQSPSRESFTFNEGDSLSQSFAAKSTPSGSPLASPLHKSFASKPHQHQQQAVYGNPRPGSRRVLPQPSNAANVAGGGVPTAYKKGYQPWNGATIQEEEEQRPLGISASRGMSKWCALVLSVAVAVLFIFFVGLIYWLVCHPSSPRVEVKNIKFQTFSVDEGNDPTGVPTQVLTANVTTTLAFRNPSKYFGFHVSAPYMALCYQQIILAEGEAKKFFQKKKSNGIMSVSVDATREPVYGAGPNLLSFFSSEQGLPLQLQIRVQSEARVIWKIVQPRYRKHIACDLVLDTNSKLETPKILSQDCHRG